MQPLMPPAFCGTPRIEDVGLRVEFAQSAWEMIVKERERERERERETERKKEKERKKNERKNKKTHEL